MLKSLIFAFLIAVVPATVVVGQEGEISYRDRVQLMYVAYYGRPGDNGGLDFWTEQLEGNGGKLSNIIGNFGNSDEFLQRFAELDNEALVNNIYRQLFNRDADLEGLQFYTGELTAERYTLASIALEVANGADAANADGLSRDNKLAAANAYSEQLASQILFYGATEIASAKAYLEGVDGSATEVDPTSLDQALSLLLPYSSALVVMNTNFGSIEIELYPELAPITVANFLAYVDSKFYEGLIFHRVISGFMIQGGGFDITLTRRTPLAPIVLEADKGISNLRGTIAMARTNVPNSATSQIFINHVDNFRLDAEGSDDGYAVFGRVISGMDVVDAIANLNTMVVGSFQDLPAEAVLIASVLRAEPTAD